MAQCKVKAGFLRLLHSTAYVKISAALRNFYRSLGTYSSTVIIYLLLSVREIFSDFFNSFKYWKLKVLTFKLEFSILTLPWMDFISVTHYMLSAVSLRLLVTLIIFLSMALWTVLNIYFAWLFRIRVSQAYVSDYSIHCQNTTYSRNPRTHVRSRLN